MRILSALRRHRPNVRLLSEHLDGRLDAPAAARLREHIASCSDCSARLEDLRQVRTALSALPEVDAPRSFRLSPAEARPRAPVRSPQPRWLAGMPALSGAALLLFAVLVGVDVYGAGRNGTGLSPGDNELLGLQSASERMPAGQIVPEAADGAMTPGDSGAFAEPDQAPGAAEDRGGDTAARAEGISEPTPDLFREYNLAPDATEADADAPAAGQAPPAGAQPAPEEALHTAVDDGGPGGLRVAQGVTAAIAVAAAAGAGIWWLRRREAQA